jgi:hypothetical protein
MMHGSNPAGEPFKIALLGGSLSLRGMSTPDLSFIKQVGRQCTAVSQQIPVPSLHVPLPFGHILSELSQVVSRWLAHNTLHNL